MHTFLLEVLLQDLYPNMLDVLRHAHSIAERGRERVEGGRERGKEGKRGKEGEREREGWMEREGRREREG